MRQEALRREALRGRKHGIESLARVLGEARPRAELLDIEPLVKQELEIAA
jgi:hypothetical protein